MASPPVAGEPHWHASPWLALVHAEIARSPASFGVVILGDHGCDPVLVASGIIREELLRLNGSPRAQANGTDSFRYIDVGHEEAASRLARIVFHELSSVTGHAIAWREFPPLPYGRSAP